MRIIVVLSYDQLESVHRQALKGHRERQLAQVIATCMAVGCRLIPNWRGRQQMKKYWTTIKRAAGDFISDEATTQAAAVAFFTALSFAPMLVITITVSSYLGDDAQAKVVDQVRGLIGTSAAGAVDMVIDNAREKPTLGSMAGILSLLTLLLSATGMLVQLQSALNTIWDVRAKPGRGVWNWLRKRVLTLGFLLVVIFILLVSLAVNAALAMVMSGQGWIWQSVNLIVSLLVFTLLFAAMFQVLPDVNIEWKNVWFGAATTAVLFIIGKWVIGLYLGNSGLGSAYGAAGSVIVFLIWVYYSCIILFFGAELTQAHAMESDSRFEPEQHAEWIHERDRNKAGKPA